MSDSRFSLPPPTSDRRRGGNADVNLIDLSSEAAQRHTAVDEFDPMLMINVESYDGEKDEMETDSWRPLSTESFSLYADLSRTLHRVASEHGSLPRPPSAYSSSSNNTSPVMPRANPASGKSSTSSRPPSTLYPSLTLPDSPVTLRHRSGRLGVALSASTSAINEVGAPRPMSVGGSSTHDLHSNSPLSARLSLVRETPNVECRGLLETVNYLRREADEGAVEENNPGLVFNPVYRKPFPIPDSIIVQVRYGRLLCGITNAAASIFQKLQCNPNSTDVAVLLTSAIPWDNLPAGNSMSASDFFLRIHGRDEFLRPSCILAQHSYFQDCNRQQWQIRLVLDHREDLHPERLKRTGRDLREEFILPALPDCKELTRDELHLLLEVFTKERENFLANLRLDSSASDCVRLTQAVKAICASMDGLATLDVLSGVENLEKSIIRGQATRDDIHTFLARLEAGIITLVRLYSVMYELPYSMKEPGRTERSVRVAKNVQDCRQTVTVYIGGLHRILASKLSGFDHVRVRALLTYAASPLLGNAATVTEGQPVRTSSYQIRSPVSGAPTPSVTVFWDEWLLFEDIKVSHLPLETVLLLSLFGVRKAPAPGSGYSSSPSTTDGDTRQRLFWATLPLFDAGREYRQGVQLIPLWPVDYPLPLSGCAPLNFDPTTPVLEIALPEMKEPLHFPERRVGDYEDIQISNFENLPASDQVTLRRILDSEESTTRSLLQQDREKLWNCRHSLLNRSDALVKVLYASPVGHPPPPDTYSLVSLWRIPEPELALQLLGPEICDIEFRTKAVEWLRSLNPDELMLYMPQLLQVFKYDLYTNSSGLFALMLEYSLRNSNFANSLFWHLKECSRSSLHARRIQILFAALLKSCGAAMKAVWRAQETLASILSTTAESVRAASSGEGRMARLQVELVKLKEWMDGEGADLCPLRIPFSLGLAGTELCLRECSYFSSFTCPLRLVFKTPDDDAPNLNFMFKAGDDLRQDGLMLQLTALMDRLWLQEGLDLRMVLFRILSTANRRGFVELVSESTTLRKIQESKGMTGAFRECVIRTWLQRHNPSQLEYKMAVHNFMWSCAGCCVATYVLGVGDRHNDNIMIGKAGHMVHIDFAKILGDAQTFAGIKRDRVPFVFTAEMARVFQDAGDEEHGGRSGFQAFIDLCCRALSILRAHADHLLGMARLLVPARIPGLRPEGVAHMRRALMLELTDLEMTAQFTRLIEKSLSSLSTTLNFFIHGLAQSKHSGHDEGNLLSFMPNNYSLKTDGRITSITIRSVQKCYVPEREYTSQAKHQRFILSVCREDRTEPWTLIRYYTQFEELHRRLTTRYPLALIPSLHETVSLPGRSHVREVAEKRRESLQIFIDALLSMASEISECDTVYTFFHSTLQDEQDFDKLDVEKLKGNSPRRESARNSSEVSSGEIELRVRYEAEQLSVLVMHAKQLKGGLGELPDTYVKVYLRPDENKQTKNKSRIVRRNFNPSYNHLIEYRNISTSSLDHWTLEVSVWESGVVRSAHIGTARIPLKLLGTFKDSQRWYMLS